MKIGQQMIGKLVVVRTYGAGVHVGVLRARVGQVVELTDARRLWRWRGANSLSEAATRGVAQDFTRLSEPVPEIVLTQAMEVIPVQEAARSSLTTSRWGS